MTTWDDQLNKVNIHNASGLRIPPFAAMELNYTGTSAVSSLNGDVLWDVIRPTSTGAATPTRIVINGPRWIEVDGYGYGVFNSRGIALVDITVAPAIGGDIGPIAGEWAMASGGLGWIYKSDDVSPAAYEESATILSAYVERAGGGGAGATLFKATMNEPWTAGVAECSIFSIDGVTFTDTAEDADVYDGLSIYPHLTTGDHLLVLKQNGKYYVIIAPCPT